MRISDWSSDVCSSDLPDGKRYAAMLIRGDIKRDGVEVEIVSGELSSIQAAKPHTAAKLFTGGLGATLLGAENATQLTLDGANFPAWIDNERVAFIWEAERGVPQVAAVNVVTNHWTMLTNSDRKITSLNSSHYCATRMPAS